MTSDRIDWISENCFALSACSLSGVAVALGGFRMSYRVSQLAAAPTGMDALELFQTLAAAGGVLALLAVMVFRLRGRARWLLLVPTLLSAGAAAYTVMFTASADLAANRGGSFGHLSMVFCFSCSCLLEIFDLMSELVENDISLKR